MEATQAITPLVNRPKFSAMTLKQLTRYIADNAAYGHRDDSTATRADVELTAALVFDRKIDDMAAALEKVASLDIEVHAASVSLNSFPKGAMGLTPDDVKFSAEYRAASARYDRAHKALRAFNGPFLKTFAKELSEHRTAVRQAKMLRTNAS